MVSANAADAKYRVAYIARAQSDSFAAWLANAVLDGADWQDGRHTAGPQSADPTLSLTYDLDPAEARRSRKAGLERAAAAGWLVTGGHVTGFSRVRAEGMASGWWPADPRG